MSTADPTIAMIAIVAIIAVVSLDKGPGGDGGTQGPPAAALLMAIIELAKRLGK